MRQDGNRRGDSRSSPRSLESSEDVLGDGVLGEASGEILKANMKVSGESDYRELPLANSDLTHKHREQG
jgi:hypothetical protein